MDDHEFLPSRTTLRFSSDVTVRRLITALQDALDQGVAGEDTKVFVPTILIGQAPLVSLTLVTPQRTEFTPSPTPTASEHRAALDAGATTLARSDG